MVFNNQVQNTTCPDSHMRLLSWYLEFSIRQMSSGVSDKYCVFMVSDNTLCGWALHCTVVCGVSVLALATHQRIFALIAVTTFQHFHSSTWRGLVCSMLLRLPRPERPSRCSALATRRDWATLSRTSLQDTSVYSSALCRWGLEQCWLSWVRVWSVVLYHTCVSYWCCSDIQMYNVMNDCCFPS